MIYKTFNDIEFHYHHDGQHSIIRFENNYLVSVVRAFPSSLGSEQGLYELSILNDNMTFDFDNPISKKPIGFLTEEEVTEIMIEIQNLQLPTETITNKIKLI